MLMVGLTGGIGAGKSAVAGRLAALGAVIIDSDRLAREVVEPGTEGLGEVVAAFGEGVLGADGALDRPALGAKVFGDEPARRRLEGIIHPRVRKRAAVLAASAPADAIVINDVPLLVEAGMAAAFPLVLVVAADEATRVARLARDRGMTEAEAYARIRTQATDAQRERAADVVLRNDTTLDELYQQVDQVWQGRLLPFEENLRLRRRVGADERLHIAPYDPSWPAQYARLAERITRAARPTGRRVDHVGSTSVPGLVAKDVIDIQLTVGTLDEADEIADALAGAGFPRADGVWSDSPKPSDPDAAVWAKRFHGSADPGRIVHLHVRAEGSPGWRLALLMRDWLRAEEDIRTEYTALKRRLASSGLSTSGYANAKEPWFDEVWPRAEEWARRTRWSSGTGA
jgi:dephospho-CoA kinase